MDLPVPSGLRAGSVATEHVSLQKGDTWSTVLDFLVFTDPVVIGWSSSREAPKGRFGSLRNAPT